MPAINLAAWIVGAVASIITTAIADADTAMPVPPEYEVVDDGIPEALTDRIGDARNGRIVFLDRDRGHCLLCHVVESIDEPFQGNLGPDLSMVADRLNAAQFRLRLVDSTRLNANTVMPTYFRVEGLRQVSRAFVGKTVLSAQEIEDVVAYLETLRTTDSSR